MELKGHTGYIGALVHLEKGFVASGSRDKTVRIWRTRDAANVFTFNTPSNVKCLCYLGNNLLAIGLDESHHVTILDVEKRTSSVINNATVNRSTHSIFSITLTGQPNHIAIVSYDDDGDMIRILNFQTGAVVHTLEGEFGEGYTVRAVTPNSIVFNATRGHSGVGIITYAAGTYSAPVFKGNVKFTIITPFDTDLILGWQDNPASLNKVYLTNIRTGVSTLFYEIQDAHTDVEVKDICKLGDHHVAVSTNIGIYILKIKRTPENTFVGERVVYYYMSIGIGGDLCVVEGGGFAITHRMDIFIYKTRYENTTRRQALRSILSRTNPNVAGHVLSFLEGESRPAKSKKPVVPVYEPPVPHNSSGEFDYVAGTKRFAERTKQSAEKVLHEKRAEERTKRLGKRHVPALRTIQENVSFLNNAPPVISKINEIDLNLNRKGDTINRKKYVQRHTFKRLSESLRQSRKRIFNSFASKLGVNELTESQKKLVENKMDNAFNRDVKVKSKNIMKLLTEPKPEPVAPVPKPKSQSRSKAASASKAANAASVSALAAELARLNALD